ncbi:mechanosensitive ion channel family protein [Novosphingobium sp. TH158]|uniref:mechanosensitive ion channel family protein n=1 Tax=Novosphingobium sp. TH158 TaxID=2067455 RepID=UPI00118192C6|nr:mechanosensitive ion channel domain-containing protein [Novosphingobium sp. TH158]
MNLRQQITEIVRQLDMIGFDVGDYRVSVYRALLMLAVTFAVIVAGRLSAMVVRRFFRRLHRLDAAQQLLGEKIVTIIVWIALAMIGVDFLGISLTALTVFSGALGLAVGFGLQKTFGNLISGIILLMDRSIKPGDVIAVGTGADKTVGQVNRIGIRAVSVITRDKIEYLIPNELLMTSQVENWSFSSRDVRVKVPVGVAYGSDLSLVEKILLEAARNLPRVLDVRPPQVWLHAFGTNAIEFEVQMWIDDPEEGLGNLRSDLLKAVYLEFAAHGIEVPYAQHDVHIRHWPKELEKKKSRVQPGSTGEAGESST